MSFITRQKHKKSDDSFRLNYQRHGKRCQLYLSNDYTMEDAETVQAMVDHLLRCETTGTEPASYVKSWIEHLAPDLRNRLEQANLIERSQRLNLMELWSQYLDMAEAVNKHSTIQTYQTVQKRFFSFFNETDSPNDITPEDGLQWRKELVKKYSLPTVAGSIQRTRAVFSWAHKNGYVKENVFLHVPRGSFINKDREHFVSIPDYRRLLDACPDQEWRTLLALCRTGGLRNPSETLQMRWIDINWEQNKVLVRSPKTEHHEGKESRLIPLFPELREELEKQFEQAREGAVFVIDQWRDTERNLRQHFERIIFRAGLEKWPRLFHNLRGSRSNELFSNFPAHVAGTWMGQCDRIAREHYLHPCDDDFNKAVEPKKSEEYKQPENKEPQPKETEERALGGE